MRLFFLWEIFCTERPKKPETDLKRKRGPQMMGWRFFQFTGTNSQAYFRCWQQRSKPKFMGLITTVKVGWLTNERIK